MRPGAIHVIRVSANQRKGTFPFCMPVSDAGPINTWVMDQTNRKFILLLLLLYLPRNVCYILKYNLT